jgi:hypothetical protein
MPRTGRLFRETPIVWEAAMFVKICLIAAAGLMALVCLGPQGHAQEFNAEKHYSVAFLACDASGHCEHMKRPLDADNEVNCMMKAGMVGAVEWLKERPGWRLSEMHCAKDGETYL